MRSDRISSLFLLGLAAYFCAASVRVGIGRLQDPGPGFIPFLCGALLALISVVIFLRGIKANVPGGAAVFGREFKRSGWILGTLILYLLLLEKLGFAITTFFFLVLCLSTFRPRSWSQIFIVSTITVAISYLLFAVWLKVQLPRSIFGI